MAEVRKFLVALNRHEMAPHHFSLQCLIHRASEGIGAQNANLERRLRTRKTVRWPIDELREIVEERGFDFVFTCGFRLCNRHGWPSRIQENHRPANREPGKHLDWREFQACYVSATSRRDVWMVQWISLDAQNCQLSLAYALRLIS